MPLHFVSRDATRLPTDASTLLPATLVGLPATEAARLPIRVGRELVPAGDLFDVEEWPDAPSADSVAFEGDLSHVSGIGQSMASGTLTVRGSAGPRLAAGMAGGRVEVFGDVSDCAGAEMRGGFVSIAGNAGRGLGGAYPGSRRGMGDGVILVSGDVGDDAGRAMRRGLIAVLGNAGDALGNRVIAGTVLVFGSVGVGTGLGMRRGTLGLLGPGLPRLLPSFEGSGRYDFPFLAVYLRQLAAWGFAVPAEVSGRDLGRYNGDRAEGGQGEILTLA